MAIKLLKELSDFSYDHDAVKKATDEGGPLIVKGVIQRADVLNQNGRIYPKNVLYPQIEVYKELVKERRAVGELDHADEPVVNLKNASHVITDIWMEEDGSVNASVEVLDNLPMGKILKGLFERNIKVGISSRALGSVSEENEGDVVSDDLHFICWDFVSEPSTPGAWMMKEGREYTREELKKIISRQDRVNGAAKEILGFQKKIRKQEESK
jgi:hypothetical protein